MTRDKFVQLMNDQIAAWRTPSLRDWIQGARLGSNANGSLRINQLQAFSGIPIHFTCHFNNVTQPDGGIGANAAAASLAILPPAVGVPIGAHVTAELFGKAHLNNPHYFRGAVGWRAGPLGDGGLQQPLADYNTNVNALRAAMLQALNTMLDTVHNNVAAFLTARNNALRDL